MSDTVFKHGVQFGGSNDFQVRHGGNSRPSFPVASGTTFKEGMVGEITADAEVQRSTAQTTRLTGIVGTRRDPIGDANNDQTIGSGKAMMVSDPAIVETKELSSGSAGVFLVNDKVYNDGNGKWRSHRTGVAPTDTRIYGTALIDADVSSADTLSFKYNGAQDPL